MRLADLHPMVECKPNDIQSCHDRIESLEDRIAYAKQLLESGVFANSTIGGSWMARQEDVDMFIVKLNKEGL